MRSRLRRFLKRLAATPMKKGEFLLSFVLARRNTSSVVNASTGWPGMTIGEATPEHTGPEPSMFFTTYYLHDIL